MRSPASLLLALALSVPAGNGSAHAQVRPMIGDTTAPVAFWTALGDTTLERLVTQALQANPNLRAAEARARAARAGRTDMALDLAPTVTASSGYSRQRLSSAAVPGATGSFPDQNFWDVGVQISWELDVFGRGRRTLQGGNALLASAEEDVRDVQVLLAAEVARAYFDLRVVQDRLSVARRNADNQRRTLEVTLERLDAGSGTGLDTERAQAQLSATLAAIPALEAASSAMEHRIGVLVGRQPGSIARELGGTVALPTMPELGAVVTPESLIRRRPDVRSAERQLAARSAFVAAAKSSYLPRVSIAGVAGYTASALEALGDSGTPRYAIGPVVSWPLFDLGRVKVGVDAARAGEAEATARYQEAFLAAEEEVETSLTAYRKARERLQHLEESAAASERAAELALLRFEEGATGFLEVLDAERTQLEAQDRLANGRGDAMRSLVAVYRAFGGSFPGSDDDTR